MAQQTTTNEHGSEDLTTIAADLAWYLREQASCTAQVEADLYRGPAPDYQIKAAINGWQGWTDDAAQQFIADVVDAASADIENTWYTALERADLLDGGRVPDASGVLAA